MIEQPRRSAPASTPPDRYRAEIDGLRALAVTAVVIHHFNQNLLPRGYLGVDIFFVISGYVITASMAARPSRGLSGFLLGFYVRRVNRLVPALLVVVAITCLLICLFNSDPGQALLTGSASILGASNIYLLPSQPIILLSPRS